MFRSILLLIPPCILTPWWKVGSGWGECRYNMSQLGLWVSNPTSSGCDAINNSPYLILLCRTPWCYAALPASLKTHPTIGPTLQVCPLICRNPVLSSFQSPLFPIFGNPNFPPCLTSGPFYGLLEKVCFLSSHFRTLDVWTSVYTLTQPDGRYGLDWQALQLCHFPRSLGYPRKLLTTFDHVWILLWRQWSPSSFSI